MRGIPSVGQRGPIHRVDDEFAVLEGYGHYLERAAGLVVFEVQDSVVGVVIWCWVHVAVQSWFGHVLGATICSTCAHQVVGHPAHLTSGVFWMQTALIQGPIRALLHPERD